MCPKTGANNWKSDIWYLIGVKYPKWKGRGRAGKETEGGNKNEYVVYMMYVCIMMYVCMYSTSQSNNPMENLIKCAPFHLTEIIVLLVSPESRETSIMTDPNKSPQRPTTKSAPLLWVPVLTGDWCCCCCSVRPWEKACIPFVLHCWVRKQTFKLGSEMSMNFFLTFRSIFISSKILIKEYLELTDKPWEVCFLKWSAESGILLYYCPSIQAAGVGRAVNSRSAWATQGDSIPSPSQLTTPYERCMGAGDRITQNQIVIAIALGYPTRLEGCRIPRHQTGTNLKISSLWLVFILPKYAIQATVEQSISDLTHW